MSAFRFRLDRVLEWRRKQCQIEESRLAACTASLNAVDQNLASLQAQRLSVGRDFATRISLPASELSALAPYYLGAKKRELEWREDRIVKENAVMAQALQVQTAQRRVKLLEKLRERRQSEFVYAEAYQLETVAAESYLSKWSLAAKHRIAAGVGHDCAANPLKGK